jgi:2-haloacid dehalogenase
LARFAPEPCAGAHPTTPKRALVQTRGRWVSFDCFGTLVDWQRGFRQILQAHGCSDTDAVVRAFHRHEAMIEAEPYRPYREVLRLALERSFADAGGARPPAPTVVADDWGSLPVFEDTRVALEALRADGWSLAVLTNCDDDLFAVTAAALGVPLDRVVTAQQVRSYKPAPAHFFRFRESIGDTPWVHVACSWFHDIAPAHKIGVPRVWIDRERTGDDPAIASAVRPNLDGIVTLLGTVLR